MKLRGIEFGPVWCSSGALGFFGDGYWYHRLMRPFGLDYGSTTFVAKTTTLLPRPGNMPLQKDGVTPKSLLPSCIKVKPFKGAVLNAVGLSGPGAAALLRSGRWQKREKPFFISFMSVAGTPEQRIIELRAFVDMLLPQMREFASPFGLEINFSCPNVGIATSGLVAEVEVSLEVASRLKIPLVPNFGPDVSLNAVSRIAENPACDAISIANTLKWGSLPDKIDWKGTWGSDVSPLAAFGGGALSGPQLFPLVLDFVQRAELQKPIVVGGGVLSKGAAETLFRAGAVAVKLGVVGMLRPWRVRGIVRRALEVAQELNR